MGSGGGVLTFLTSTSFTLRKMHTLHMLSYDHQGGGGWGGVLTSLTSTSFTLRQMQTLHMLSVVSKIIPTKGSSWPKSTTNKISPKRSLLRLRLIIFEVVCGIIAGTQQMDGTWKHLKKWRPPSMLHKNYFTSCDPHHDIYTCSYWHIFWHST